MRSLLLLALALALGCAHYTPQPLDLEAAPAAYRARSLSDPALLAALDSVGFREGDHWDDWALAYAAWLMRPERDRLAAEIRVAEAGLIAAGGRPSPGVEGGVEGTFSGKDGSSPWAVALSGLFRLEFGGKRDARIARAEAAVLAAKARAEVAGWDFRVRVRHRLSELGAATLIVSGAEDRLAQADRVAGGYERRFNEGSIGATEFARIRGDRDAIQAEMIALRAEANAATERLELESGLPEWRITLPERGLESGCDSGATAMPDSLFRLALTHRLELAVVLAEYQQSEADVRIAVAASWPDLELGPGLMYDHGAGKWTIGLGLPTIPTNYRGPLIEAMARRDVQAARVAEVQTLILAEVRGALRRCESARAALEELGPVTQRALERVQSATMARDRGETDEILVNQAMLELLRWHQVSREAWNRQLAAGLDLEAAVGIWRRETVTESEDPSE